MKIRNSRAFSFSPIDKFFYVFIPTLMFLLVPLSQIYFISIDLVNKLISWNSIVYRFLFVLFLEYILFHFANLWTQKYGYYYFEVTSEFLVVRKMQAGIPLKIKLSWNDISTIEESVNIFGEPTWIINAKHGVKAKKMNMTLRIFISKTIRDDDVLVGLIQRKLNIN